jgi:membrane protease YdiL (CAAX protease family)
MVNWSKVKTFLIILFCLTSAAFFSLYNYFNRVINVENLSVYTTSLMMTPLLSALIVEKLFKTSRPLFPLRVNLNRYFLFSWLFPVGLVFLILLVSLLIPGNELGFHAQNLAQRSAPFADTYQVYQMELMYQTYPLTIPWILFTGLFTNLLPATLLAYGEERGWRGFLSLELAPLGFWPSSFLTGFIWGLWHTPLIWFGYNFPTHPLLGIGLMAISCALLSPWMTYLSGRANHPLAAAIFHASFNGVIGISIAFMSYNTDLIIGPFGLIGIGLLLFLNLLLYLLIKKNATKTDINYVSL